jgi:hypothetical protein
VVFYVVSMVALDLQGIPILVFLFSIIFLGIGLTPLGVCCFAKGMLDRWCDNYKRQLANSIAEGNESGLHVSMTADGIIRCSA